MAEDNMEKLGIAALAKYCYRELSGGQQQRALLARALCAARKILLLDEPAAGLDPKVTAEFYALIGKLNEEGITIIIISHDICASVKYASHILHIGDGSTVFSGTKPDYLESEAGRVYARFGDS
jgi:zinc transport system ATP-binding protein